MFGKEKYPEFIEQMYKDKTGPNNPMWSKSYTWNTIQNEKAVWVYDSTSKELIKKYEGTVQLKKDLNMGNDTIKKYLDSNKFFKGKLFKSSPIQDN